MLELYRSTIVLLILGVTLSGPLVASDTNDISGSDSEAPAAEAGEVGFTDTLTVTATGTPVELEETGRHVEVISGEVLRAQGVRSLPEALQLLPGLDVRRRGVWGMQADLSIRGGSFEQVLVLVDGMPVTNPQTGHHTLDLPVPISAVERIEVLYGPGSGLHGAGAIAGVVQIFTREADGTEVAAEALAGEHSLASGQVDLTWDGFGRHALSLERAESTGYRTGTEFDRTRGWYTGRFGKLRLAAGASSHDFGAQNFYSTRFPDQVEFTDAILASGTWEDEVGEGILSLRLGAREHRDLYILDRFDPGLLTNRHEDRTGDAELAWRRPTPAGVLELGASGALERLESTNLGDRRRDRAALFGSLVGGNDLFSWRGAVHAERVEGRTEVHPNLALTRRLGPGHARLAAGTAYRLPSFTELYYTSPASVGNPELEPEQATTYELGYDWVRPRTRLSATLFERRGRDLVDFVQAPGETLFRARNLRRVRTRGAELSAARTLRLGSGRLDVSAAYAWLDSSGDEPEGVSAYVFDYLRDRVQLTLEGSGFGPFRFGTSLSWNRRNGQDDYLRLDGRVGWRPAGSAWELFVEGSNLGSARYFEQGGVEMPRRWLAIGVRWEGARKGDDRAGRASPLAAKPARTPD